VGVVEDHGLPAWVHDRLPTGEGGEIPKNRGVESEIPMNGPETVAVIMADTKSPKVNDSNGVWKLDYLCFDWRFLPFDGSSKTA
jgi:hypothetical protein